MLWDNKTDQHHNTGLTHRDPNLGRKKLPPELQKLVDREEEFLDQLYDG